MTATSYHLELEVRDAPGVLVRIAHVFARRSCNIRSLHVEPGPVEPWSMMSIVVQDVPRIDQILQQLEKLVDVRQVVAHEEIRE